MSRAMRRRVGRLTQDARRLAIECIRDDDVMPLHVIARRSFVFIEEAARVSRKQYTPAETAAVLERFRSAWDELVAVTHHG